MKLNLTALDRFGMLSILPAEGNYLTLGLLRKLKEELGFDEEEQKAYKITITPDGRALIGDELLVSSFDIPDTIFTMVKEKLKEMERTSKLTSDVVPLYEKIVLEKK